MPSHASIARKRRYNKTYGAKHRERHVKRETLRRHIKREKLAGRPKASRCEVCGADDKPIHFDHDHKTGEFRGWICSNCNRALGFAADSPDRLRLLAAYLERVRQ